MCINHFIATISASMLCMRGKCTLYRPLYRAATVWAPINTKLHCYDDKPKMSSIQLDCQMYFTYWMLLIEVLVSPSAGGICDLDNISRPYLWSRRDGIWASVLFCLAACFNWCEACQVSRQWLMHASRVIWENKIRPPRRGKCPGGIK